MNNLKQHNKELIISVLELEAVKPENFADSGQGWALIPFALDDALAAYFETVGGVA